MLKKITASCLLAAALGCANTIKAVVLTTEWSRRDESLPPSAEVSLPAGEAAAGPGESDPSMHLMAIKARPVPLPQPIPKTPGKPQPTPRPTPVPPGVKPPGPTPAPTPPVTRPT